MPPWLPGPLRRLLDQVLRVRSVILATTVVPLLATAMVAWVHVSDRLDARSRAVRLEHEVELAAALATLTTNLRDEEAFAVAAALPASLDVPLDVVEEILGVDLDGGWARARASADVSMAAALDVARRLDGALPPSHPISRVSAGVAGLAGIRADGAVSLDDLTTRYGDVNRLAVATLADELDELDRLVDDAGLGGGDLGRQVEALELVTRSGDLATREEALVSSLLLSSPQLISLDDRAGSDPEGLHHRLAAVAAVRRDLLARIPQLLPPDLAGIWARLRERPDVLRFEAAVEELSEHDSMRVDDVVGTLADGLHRFRLHGEITEPLTASMLAHAARLQAAAAADVSDALLLVAAAIAATLAVGVAATSAIVRPLRHLERRARRLRAGETELPARRPALLTEARVVSRVVDEVACHLHVLEAQTDAIANGQLDDPVLDVHVPGRLAAGLRRSVQRLSGVTADLRASEALARAVVDNAAEAIWAVGADGRIAGANAAAERLVGRPAAEQAGLPFVRFLVDGDTIEDDLVAGRLASVEVRLTCGDGRMRFVLLSSSGVGPDFPVVTVFARDITDRVRLEARLAQQARSDALTGLANRVAAVDGIAAGLARAGRAGTGLAVVFLDLDGFKLANDGYGHAFGDRLLRGVGQRLHAVVREGELLARLGGDEFVVVAEQLVDPTQALRLAERLHEALSFPIEVGGQLVSVRASFGIAFTDDPSAEPLELLRDADIAMYRAKGSPDPIRLFDAALRREVAEQGEVERNLARAITSHELSVVYQPVVDTKTCRPVGFEALVRWTQPDGSVTPPDEFIPVAEETGLVVDLDRWVLRAVARQLAAWKGSTPADGLPVAVNIAGSHLVRHDLVADLLEACTAAGVEPSSFVIEITESQLIRDLDEVSDVLRRLRSLGVSVLIDDFGTGFSSFGYLRQLPIDGVKIDRSLVSGDADPRNGALVTAVCQLSAALDILVVAEGVETADQHRQLIRRGCDQAQGHLFAHPMDVDELDAWLTSIRSVEAAGDAGDDTARA